MLPGLFGGTENNIFMIIQTLISILFVGMVFFFPRLMVWNADRKMKSLLTELETYRDSTESRFLDKLTDNPSESTKNRLESVRNVQFSAPTSLDPAGMVGKLEHILDTSENKFKRFVRAHADTEDEEEIADLNMAFKGVMGTHQMYKVIRHFRQLVNKTKNYQIVGLVQMMLPIYEEMAKSQKEATRAFLDGAPIGDGIGPLVAAKLIEDEPEEEIAENVIHSEEEIDDQTVHVIKSRGPGARLGKYGDAIDTLAEENDLEAVITVDAASKFEGEETGSVAEGVGVMMGGPGVEKSKIEEAATEHDVPLEGVVIKQSAPEASKPMKREIYDAYEEAIDKVEQTASEFDGEVAVVGVGNTCGVGNTREDVRNVHSKLRKYWKEYEEQEDEDVSYQGLLSVMPGGDSSAVESSAESMMWNFVR
jgi:hypothetical protein